MSKRIVWTVLIGAATVVGTSAAWSFGLFTMLLASVSPADKDPSGHAGADTTINSIAIPGSKDAVRSIGRPWSSIDQIATVRKGAPPENNGNATPKSEPEPGDLSPNDSDEVLMQRSLDMLLTDCTSDITNPNPGDPPPGAWANPDRMNTGWSLAYNKGSKHMGISRNLSCARFVCII